MSHRIAPVAARSRPLRAHAPAGASVYCDGTLYFGPDIIGPNSVPVRPAQARRKKKERDVDPPRALRSRTAIDAHWPDGPPSAGYGRRRCLSSRRGRDAQCGRAYPGIYFRGRDDGSGCICEDCVNELLIGSDRFWRFGTARVRTYDLATREQDLRDRNERFCRRLVRAIDRALAHADDGPDDEEDFSVDPYNVHPLAGSDARLSVQEALELRTVAPPAWGPNLLE